jgi:hypothetical protein
MRDMHQKVKKKIRLGCFWALWKVLNKAIPTVPPQGQRDEWKALKLSVKAANVPKWAQHSQESIWESGGKWKMGQESE